MSDTVALKKFYCDIVRSLEAELKKREPQTSVQCEIERFGQVKKIYDRRNGRKFSINDHAEAMIMALLSCQTEWNDVQDNLDTLKIEVFENFDADYLTSTRPEDLVSKMVKHTCWKKVLSSKQRKSMEKKMGSISPNIKSLKTIHGHFRGFADIDDFLGKTPPLVAVDILDGKQGSPIKLEQVSISLIPEYMRNVGINMAKPDTHIMRLLGEDHFKGFFEQHICDHDWNESAKELGVENYEEARKPRKIKKEFRAVITIAALAKHLDSAVYEGQTATASEVDNVLWMFCANKYGEICKKIKPRCCICQARDRCATGISL